MAGAVGLGAFSDQLLDFVLENRFNEHFSHPAQQLAEALLKQFGDVGGRETQLHGFPARGRPGLKPFDRSLLSDLISFLHATLLIWDFRHLGAYHGSRESRSFLRSSGHPHLLCHLPDPNAPSGGGDEYTATLLGSNVVPPVDTTRTGNCVGELLSGNLLQIVCTHNVPNVIRGSYRLGAAGQEGPEIWRDAFGPTPVGFDCFLDQDELEALLDGGTYIELNTISNPNGEVRGQVNPLAPPSLGMCDPGDAPDGLLPYTDGAYQGRASLRMRSPTWGRLAPARQARRGLAPPT